MANHSDMLWWKKELRIGVIMLVLLAGCLAAAKYISTDSAPPAPAIATMQLMGLKLEIQGAWHQTDVTPPTGLPLIAKKTVRPANDISQTYLLLGRIQPMSTSRQIPLQIAQSLLEIQDSQDLLLHDRWIKELHGQLRAYCMQFIFVDASGVIRDRTAAVIVDNQRQAWLLYLDTVIADQSQARDDFLRHRLWFNQTISTVQRVNTAQNVP